MKKLPVAVLVAVLTVALQVHAAPSDPGSSPASDAMEKINKILNQRPFTAKAVMNVTPGGAHSQNRVPGPMEFLICMSQGKSRMEMDFSKMMGAAGGSSQGMPPGLDKMVTISRPDKKVVYQMIPGMNAYCEIAISDVAAGKADSSVKIDRKPMGKEKVESYNCEKVLNTMTASDGTKVEIMTWEAKEFGGMPVKTEIESPEGKMTMVFKDIKTDKPADSLFEPPAGFTKYNSMQELMMGAMMKNMTR